MKACDAHAPFHLTYGVTQTMSTPQPVSRVKGHMFKGVYGSPSAGNGSSLKERIKSGQERASQAKSKLSRPAFMETLEFDAFVSHPARASNPFAYATRAPPNSPTMSPAPPVDDTLEAALAKISLGKGGSAKQKTSRKRTPRQKSRTPRRKSRSKSRKQKPKSRKRSKSRK